MWYLIEIVYTNYLGTILAGGFLYFFLERRVRNNFRNDEIKRILKNLAGDLTYNYIRAKRSYENQEEYLHNDRFTLGKYRTENLTSFYYSKPFPEKAQFPYTKLMGIIARLEDNNALADLVFKTSDGGAITSNKVQFLENTIRVMNTITEFLNEIQPFFTERNLVLGEYS